MFVVVAQMLGKKRTEQKRFQSKKRFARKTIIMFYIKPQLA